MHSPHRSRLLLAALLLPALLAGCGNTERSRQAHIERGEQYLRDGNLKKAQVEFRNAIQIAPGRADARMLNARVDERLGDYRDALALYQSAVEAEPDNPAAHAGLGRLYVLAGQPQRALDAINVVLVRHPDDPDLLTVRGAARAGLKQMEDAIADAERAHQLAPLNEDTVSLLAALYDQQGNTQRAVELVRTTLDRKPDSRDLHAILASLYEKLGRNDLVEAQLRQVVRLAPAELAPRSALVAFYLRTGRADDAERVLRTTMADQPGQDLPRLAYVQFLKNQRSAAAAEQALRDLIGKYPGDFDLQLALGELQGQDQTQDAAIATYNGVLAKAGDSPAALAARNGLATIFVQQRRFDEAASQVAQVLARSAADDGALQLRAEIALARGESGTAVTDLRSVLHDQPHSVAVLRALSRAYQAGGDTALAEESLRNAIDASPREFAAVLDLAQLLVRSQRADAAVQLLEEAKQRLPKDLELREALVQIYIGRADYQAADAAANGVVEAAATDWRGPYLQSLVAQARRHPEDASRALERALVLKPDALAPLTAISRLDVTAGRKDQAVARVRAQVTAHPQDAVLHNLLGEVLVSAGDPSQAAAEFDRAQQLQPLWWLPYHNLGSVQQSRSQIDTAIGTYKQGVVATRQEPELVIDLASIYEQAGRSADAIQTYENFCREFPGITITANNLAMLLVTHKADAASFQQARDLTARFMTSTTPELLDTAGWVRLKSGDLAAALPVLEEAVQREPESRVMRYHLGMAQLQAGRRQQARASLEAALQGAESFEGSAEARSALATLANSHHG